MTAMVSDRDWLLNVLSDGKPHSHAELLRRSQAERGCGLTPHSRAADLRKQGHDIEVTTWRANGRVHSSYQLVSRVEPQSPLSSPDGTPAVCGSTDEIVSLAESSPPIADGDLVGDGGDSAGETVQPSLFQIPASARRGAYDEDVAA